LGSLAQKKPEVNPNPAVRLEAAKHPDVQALLKSLDDNKQCEDDPKWVDADGDNCAVYADHIASKQLSQDQACMYGDGGARDHCRLTCGTCIYGKSRRNHSPKGKGKGRKGKGKGRFARLRLQGKGKENSAPAPIPSPYRARASPKMVPSAPVDPSPAASHLCMDDPEWLDQDGDSCAVYADKIKSGEFLLDEACGYQDEAAKKHCPMTCNLCPQKNVTPLKEFTEIGKEFPTLSFSPALAKKEACIDDPDWVDQDGDGCVAYATAIRAGTFDREEACGYSDGKAKLHCRATCNTCLRTEHTAVHENLLAHRKPLGPKMVPQDPNALVKKVACVDDPDWADQDGDNCAAYAKAIKEGHITQVEACGFSGGKAKQHCLVTCNACTRTHSSQQNLLHHPPQPTKASQAVQFV